MSDQDHIDPMDNRDDKTLAAEFSLGLLEGEELMAARGRLASDEDFAWRKEWWDNWFVPMSDDVAGAEPSAAVWDGIEARMRAAESDTNVVAVPAAEAASSASNDNVIDLQSRLRRWQLTAGVTSAAAAIALAVLVFAPGSAPPTEPTTQIAAADPLMATVPIGDTGLRLDVTYMPESERMLITAIGLTADGVHDHELWLVPAEGDLQSLGVVAPGEVVSMDLPESIARNILDGSEIVLTREPIGGKPADQ
ncbi:MAG: anti-sigma factor, partial [Pseudomonadota bacterium]